MRCPSEGDLRSMLDNYRQELWEHVRSCKTCSRKLESISQQRQVSARKLLANNSVNCSAQQAYRSFVSRIERSKNMEFSEFGRRNPRPVLALVALLVLLPVLVLLTPIRSAAESLLNVMRVEKFTAITIDPSELPFNIPAEKYQQEWNHQMAARFDKYDKTDLQRELKEHNIRKVDSVDEASKMYKGPVATIPKQGPPEEIYVSGPESASFTVDLQKIRAELKDAGIQGVTLPKQLNGKTFTLDVPSAVVMRYGQDNSGFVFVQGESPTLVIPEGVNMDYVRQDILMTPGLPPDLVKQIQSIKDWQHTLVIPVPPGGDSKNVRIGRSEGLLVSDRTREHNLLLWKHDDRLYAIGGKISSEDAISIARSVVYP